MIRAALVGFLLDKDLCIGESWVQGNKTGGKEGIEHGLNKGAVGGFLWRGASVSQEESAGCAQGPNVGGDVH